MALTDQGFNRPTYNEILDAQIARAKQLFGNDIDTSELSALGKYIRINVADLDALYQDLEGVFYARFPHTASGVNLDRLLPFAGIVRGAATYAQFTIEISGTPNGVVNTPLQVSNEDQSVVFHLLESCTLNNNGVATALVECNYVGSVGNILPTKINTIVNGSAVVDSIVGVDRVIDGEDRESDASVRVRFDEAIAGAGSGTAEAIRGALMRVNGVDGCTVVENNTDETVNGISPHSFMCYVSYDSTDNSVKKEIAEAIFKKKPIGIKSCGSDSFTIEDTGGHSHTIHFEHTTSVSVYIKIQLTKNVYFEDDGADTIKENLVNYLATFTNGTDVYLSALYSYINITGVVNVLSLKLSTDGTNYSAANVLCSDNEIARTKEAFIEITDQQGNVL